MRKNTDGAAGAGTLCSWWRGGATLPVLVVLALLHALSAHAQPPPVVQRGYDAGVSGATLSETTLNKSNVVPGSFGMVFKLPVDDNIMAQPLYVPNVTINGASHNVLYVATMNDTLYAFDADVGGAALWTRNLAAAVGAVPVPIAQFAYSANKNIIGNLGILSTPVIDPSGKTLYAVACTLENNTLVYRLHAVDITSGVLRNGSGVVISGTYRTMTFDARNQWQRISPVLAGENVVFGFGALELESTDNLYSGWVMAYDKSSLAQTGIFATVTAGNGGAGVWQSGRPPVVDGSGFVYVATGNGYNSTGYDGVHNFSESVLKLDPAHGLSLVDWFTPSDWSTLDDLDLDLTSSGPMLVPGTNLLVAGGKTGVLYLLNTAGLGKNTANDSGAIQKVQIATATPPATPELRGGPVYWQRSTANGGPLLYDWGADDALKAFSFNGATIATAPSATGTVTSQIWPGGILTLSANGETSGTGVLWATVATSLDAERLPPVPGALYAFDAGNVATKLWDSNMNATRDSVGNFAKFVPPLVANGRVYVATWSKQVAVYGLIAPILTAVSPASGPITGGTPVTLTGQNFGSGTRVTFGGVAATSVVVVSATQITASTPPHAQGSVNVVVTNSNGLSATRAGGFTFVASPTLTAISPASGPATGSTPVTLTGQGFASGAQVTFGGVAASSVVVVSATQITAITPPHAQGSVNVVVTNSNGQGVTLANGFRFVGSATLTAVSPASGPATGSTPVTLTGQGFASGAQVTFGGVAATSVVVVSATEITAKTPPHAQGSVPVVVTNSNGQSATLAGGFTFVASPTLTAVSPASGPATGSTPVTLTGQGFASGAQVTFGGVAASSVVVVSATQITARTPPHAQGSVSVTVTNSNGQGATLAGGFTFLASPTLTAVSPASGPATGSTPVRLTGQGFASGAKVTFGGVPATSVVVVSATQVTANTPPHAQGRVNVVVTNSNGQSATLANGFTFGAPAPTLTSVSPNTGHTRGGTPVTLHGMNFIAGATVTFGSLAATSVVVVNATQITAKTPAHVQGSVNVVVTNPDGRSATLPNGFTFGAPAPTVSSVSPDTGRTSGGMPVMLRGMNFVAGATVTFGDAAATSVAVVSATQIKANTPPHKPGGVKVVVTNPDRQRGTLAHRFIYHPH
jgi:IPT/TIG domain